MTLSELFSRLGSFFLEDGLRIVFALLAFLIIARLITLVFRRLERHFLKRELDKTVTRALLATGRYAALVATVLLLLGFLGVDTGSLAALLASLGVGAGLAINGALSNLAGGVLLLLTRPFRLDDYIEVEGQEGTVEDIRLVTTRLRTIDGRIIYLPNGTVSSGTIVNYSEDPVRRLDLTFSLSAAADVGRVRALLLSLSGAEARILPSPAPYVVITGRDAGGLHFSLRAYVRNTDYWDVRFSLLEAASTALTEAGLPPAGQRMDIRGL